METSICRFFSVNRPGGWSFQVTVAFGVQVAGDAFGEPLESPPVPHVPFPPDRDAAW
jgi:hypothetical protein